MAKIAINVGTTANDGTGETLRQAGLDMNSNFSELYGIPHPGYRSGKYYSPGQHIADSNNAVTQNLLYIHLVPLRKGMTLSGLTLVNGATVASSKGRAGLYAMTGDLSSGIAATKLAETAAEFDLSSGTFKDQAFASNLVISSLGWGFAVSCYNLAGMSMYGYDGLDTRFVDLVGASASSGASGVSNFIKGWTAPFTYGALPADFTALTLSELTGSMPKVTLKTA